MYDLAHILLFYFSVPANDRFANSFLATAAWLVRADVIRLRRRFDTPSVLMCLSCVGLVQAQHD